MESQAHVLSQLCSTRHSRAVSGPIMPSRNQGHEPCKEQLDESLPLTPSCHYPGNIPQYQLKEVIPEGVFKKLLFVCTNLIFKNYEAQMFCWRKNCVKDISKDVAGKGSSMNRKRRIGNPLLSLVLVLSLESIKQKVAEK